MTEQELREQVMLAAFEDELEKISSIALTRAGHDYYASEGKAREKYHTDMRRASSQYNAEQPWFADSGKPISHRMKARRAAYQKRKHSKGKQGWNPFGFGLWSTGMNFIVADNVVINPQENATAEEWLIDEPPIINPGERREKDRENY